MMNRSRAYKMELSETTKELGIVRRSHDRIAAESAMNASMLLELRYEINSWAPRGSLGGDSASSDLSFASTYSSDRQGSVQSAGVDLERAAVASPLGPARFDIDEVSVAEKQNSRLSLEQARGELKMVLVEQRRRSSVLIQQDSLELSPPVVNEHRASPATPAEDASEPIQWVTSRRGRRR